MDDSSSQVLASSATDVPTATVPATSDDSPVRWSRRLRDQARDKWVAVSPSIPGTLARRRRHRREIRDRVRRSLAAFDALTTLSDDARRQSRAGVRRHLNRIAVVGFAADTFDQTVTSVMIPVAFATLALTLYALTYWVPVESINEWGFLSDSFLRSLPTWLSPVGTLARWLVFAWLYIMGMALALFVAAWPVLALQAFTGRATALLTLGWALTVATTAAWWARNTVLQSHQAPLETGRFLILASLAGLVVYLGAVFAIALATVFGRRWYFERRRTRTHPASAVVADLIEILTSLEQSPGQWTRLDVRRRWLVQLERVASCLETHLPYRLRHRDHVTNHWASLAFARMAAAIRELKRAIITPKPDSRQYVMRVVGDSLYHAARGEWDGFPHAEPEPLSRAGRWSVFGQALGTIFSAGLPLVIVTLGTRSGMLPLQQPVEGYVWVGAVVWAIVCVLAALDPTFGTKVTALTDVTGLLPIPGRGKKATD